jgi:hypothetical protein
MLQVHCASATDWSFGVCFAAVPLQFMTADQMNLPKWIGRDNGWGFFHELGEVRAGSIDSTAYQAYVCSEFNTLSAPSGCLVLHDMCSCSPMHQDSITATMALHHTKL